MGFCSPDPKLAIRLRMAVVPASLLMEFFLDRGATPTDLSFAVINEVFCSLVACFMLLQAHSLLRRREAAATALESQLQQRRGWLHAGCLM